MGYPTRGVHMERVGSRRSPDRLHRDLGHIVWEGALTNVYVVLTGGAFVTGLAMLLGAGDFEIALLAALPLLAQTAQLASGLIERPNLNRKKLSVIGLTVGRQLWWLALPLIFLPGDWRLAAFLVVVTASSLSAMAIAPIWLAWIADLVPHQIRGRFFASRNIGVAVTTLIFSVGGSLVLDFTKAHGNEQLGFAIVVIAAVLASGLGSLVLGRVSAGTTTSRDERPRHADWLAPLRDPAFRNILRVFFVWNFAIGISAAFFVPHMLLNLKMSFFQIGLYSSYASLIALAVTRPWGVLIDRFGSRNVVAVCALGIGAVPLFWLFVRADLLWILIIEVTWSALVWTGFNLAAFTLPIDKSPSRSRTLYLAWFAAVTGIGFFLASLVGGLAAEWLAGWYWVIGAQTLIHYHILFVASSVLRLASVGLLFALTQSSERGIPMMVQLVGHAVLKILSLGRQVMPFAVDGVDSRNQSDSD